MDIDSPQKEQTYLTEGHIFLVLLGLVVLAGAAAGVMQLPTMTYAPLSPVTDFITCASAGNLIMESYPRQCRTEDGRTFVEAISDNREVPTPSEETPLPYDDKEVIALPPQPHVVKQGGCAVAGCSGQLCVEADTASTIVTTCEFLPAYACYRSATCTRQTTGRCGWTPTPELSACLANTDE